MIDVTIHYRNAETQQRALPTRLNVGTYVMGNAGLFVVAAVLLGDTSIDVYAVRVGEPLASELLAEWAQWGDGTPGDQQGSLPNVR